MWPYVHVYTHVYTHAKVEYTAVVSDDLPIVQMVLVQKCDVRAEA